jgi:hypothetical protein
MIWEWIAAKGTSLMSFVIGLGFLGIAAIYGEYRYFFLCVALISIYIGVKQLRKQDTPFQKHEREMRRKQM